MGPALHNFRQGKSLLTRIALGLLRIGVIFFQLLKLLRIALQHRNNRLQLRQLVTVLLNKARGLLRFVQTFPGSRPRGRPAYHPPAGSSAAAGG